ncbi:MAG: hypothetical protein HQ592_06825 [Planctomycetes bacterium]|nr:hypothetical protein [Planctomycetota bacterium]
MTSTETRGTVATFRRYGRSYHLKIDTAEDLERVAELDEAHWVATNAPISTINCDATFLKLLDTDANGRIMCHEVSAGVRWLLGVLRDRTGIAERSQTLRLDALDTTGQESARIAGAARKILASIGLHDTTEITLDQVRKIKAKVESTPVSEAGVVLPEAGKDDEIKQFIADIISTVGGTPHPSGAQGVSEAQLEQFLKKAAAYLEWHERGQIPTGQDKTDIMPFGTETPSAYAALTSVRGKIDQYFAQCEAAAFDESLVQRMGWTETELEGLDFDDPAVIEEVLRKAPLTRARPSRELSFDDQINPCYAKSLDEFRGQVAGPVLGEPVATLTAAQWRQVKAAFAAHKAWAESEPQTDVEKLGLEKLRACLDERFAATVRALAAASAETAFVLDNIRLTEKLILYQAEMIDFANNFVSFPYLYNAANRAMFEMGTLVMDGRRFNLAVRVENRAQHDAVAKSSNIYVLYAEVAPANGTKYEVAVPATSGGKGNLCVGKRGVFRDIHGKESDAVVVQIIDNPVALREALVSPFIRLGRLVTGKIESITSSAEKEFDSQASVAMDRVASAPGTAQKQGIAASGGMQLMGAGVALAAVGSAVAYIAKTVGETVEKNPWHIVAAVAGAALLVMLPTCIVAYLKLRKRDLSAILEGAGWGINARMRLTGAQGRFFTKRPRYPKGARGVHYFLWRGLIVIALLLAICSGGYLLQDHLKGERQEAPPPVTGEQKPPGATPDQGELKE